MACRRSRSTRRRPARLDERHLEPAVGQPPRGDLARRARTEHDHVELRVAMRAFSHCLNAPRADRLPRPPAPRRRRGDAGRALLHRRQRRALPRRSPTERGIEELGRRRARLPLHPGARRLAARAVAPTRRATTSTPTAPSCARRPTSSSGIEADFIPGREDRMAELLAGRDFDYVVGSIHFVGDGALDYDLYDIWTAATSPEKVWRTYFEWLGRGRARAGMFDILAHPDLVKYWGARAPAPAARPAPLLRDRDGGHRRVRHRGRGLHRRAAQARRRALPRRGRSSRWCVDAGNPIALSSDAHTPEELGRDYDQALELLERRSACASCASSSGASGGWSRSAHVTRPTGIGWDSHRLVAGRPLILGGVADPARPRPRRPLRRRRAHPRGHRRAARRRRPRATSASTSPTPTSATADADSIALLRTVVARSATAGWPSRTSTPRSSWSARSSRPTATRSATRWPAALGRRARAGQRQGLDRRGHGLRRARRGRRRAGGGDAASG